MSILFISHQGMYNSRSNTVRIPAMDNNRLVVCAISCNAITSGLWTDDNSPMRLLEIYHRHKNAFHLLARHKYQIKRVEPDGTILID
jgi:hypothetical protein